MLYKITVPDTFYVCASFFQKSVDNAMQSWYNGIVDKRKTKKIPLVTGARDTREKKVSYNNKRGEFHVRKVL